MYIFKDFIYLFILERGEGEKHQCVVASCTHFTGDLARNPGMCPDWESNQRPFDSQTSTQPLRHTSQGQFAILFTAGGQIESPTWIHSDPVLRRVRELTTLQYHLIPLA